MAPTSQQFLYRTATLNDVPRFKALAVESYGQYAAEITPEHLMQMKERMTADSTWTGILSSSSGFVCELDNKIIGMAFLVHSENPWDCFKAEWCYIRMVGVSPEHQGFGIATELTNMCISRARELNEQTIALHTSEMMPAARHIYEKIGFKVLHEIPERFGKRYWVYTMKL